MLKFKRNYMKEGVFMNIGAQLYTVRDFTKTEADFESTLKKISDMGYKSIQISAVGPIEPKIMREIADKNQLEIAITHSNPDRIKNDTLALIEEHKIMGCKDIGLGWYKFDFNNPNAIEEFISEFDEATKIMNKHGMKFHYHNHAFEFQKIGNETGYEKLVRLTDPDLWGFILDTYWVQVGGKNPVDTIYSLKGRIESIHLKDFAIIDDKQHMAEILEGNLDWNKILTACESTGIKYGLVEQDTDWAVGPFESLKTSFDNLKNLYSTRG